MATEPRSNTKHLYTQRELMQAFQQIGITSGQTVMLHASVNAVGPVMGGPNVILQALFDALTPTGTVMMYAGWEDIPDFVAQLSADSQQIYHAEHPPFDPTIARAVRQNSILAEFLRTWPHAKRSQNPEASMVAVGAQAERLTEDHPLQYGYGLGSPLAKLVEWGGKILMLGAPLDTITLLHYAENRARMTHKNVVHYSCPILSNGQTVWVDIEDFNTGECHAEYSFEGIAHAYLAEQQVSQGTVGQAYSYLFDAANLVNFAIQWLEKHFG